MMINRSRSSLDRRELRSEGAQELSYSGAISYRSLRHVVLPLHHLADRVIDIRLARRQIQGRRQKAEGSEAALSILDRSVNPVRYERNGGAGGGGGGRRGDAVLGWSRDCTLDHIIPIRRRRYSRYVRKVR